MSILQRIIAAAVAIAVVFIVTNIQLSGRESIQQKAASPEATIENFNAIVFAEGSNENTINAALTKYLGKEVSVSVKNTLAEAVKKHADNEKVLNINVKKEKVMVLYQPKDSNVKLASSIDTYEVHDGFITFFASFAKTN